MSIIRRKGSRSALKTGDPSTIPSQETSADSSQLVSRFNSVFDAEKEDWSILLEKRFKQSGRKINHVDVALHRTMDAESALKVLKEVYVKQKLEEKTKFLGPILDHLEAFNEGLTSIFQGVPYNSTMLIWGCAQLLIRVGLSRLGSLTMTDEWI